MDTEILKIQMFQDRRSLLDQSRLSFKFDYVRDDNAAKNVLSSMLQLAKICRASSWICGPGASTTNRERTPRLNWPTISKL